MAILIAPKRWGKHPPPANTPSRNPHLVLAFHGGQGPSQVVHPAVMPAKYGALTNGPTWVASPLGRGLLMTSGSGHYVDYDTRGVHLAGKSFTLITWHQPQGMGGDMVLGSWGDSSGQSLKVVAQALRISGQMLSTTFYNSDLDTFLPSALVAGRLYMHAITFDDVTSARVQYQDGIFVSSDTVGFSLNSGADRTRIGKRSDDGWNPYDGVLSAQFWYDRALSAAKIRQRFISPFLDFEEQAPSHRIWVTVATANVTGTGGVTFGAPAIAASGAETFTGTAAEAFAAPALAASGTSLLAITGSGAVSLSTAALAATATETFTGPAAESIGAPAFAADGTSLLAITGTAAVSIAAPALAATASETFTGTAAEAIGAPPLAGTGTSLLAITGTGGVSISAPDPEATATETFTGTASETIGGPALNASGSVFVGTSGDAAVTVSHPTLDAAGSALLAITGTGNVSIGVAAVDASGTALLAITGTGALSLAAPGLAATGTIGVPGITATGAVAFGVAGIAATGVLIIPITGTGSITISVPMITGQAAPTPGRVTIGSSSRNGVAIADTRRGSLGTSTARVGGVTIADSQED